MTDPIGGATSKIASEMAKEVQQAMQQAEQLTKSQEVGAGNFQNRLETQQLTQVNDPNKIPKHHRTKRRQNIEARHRKVRAKKTKQ